eukprot:CFRG1441T1
MRSRSRSPASTAEEDGAVVHSSRRALIKHSKKPSRSRSRSPPRRSRASLSPRHRSPPLPKPRESLSPRRRSPSPKRRSVSPRRKAASPRNTRRGKSRSRSPIVSKRKSRSRSPAGARAGGVGGRRSRSPVRERDVKQYNDRNRNDRGPNRGPNDRFHGAGGGFRGGRGAGGGRGRDRDDMINNRRNGRAGGKLGGRDDMNSRGESKDIASVPVKFKPMPEVDREKTCPLLLRLFCSVGEHHALSEYTAGKVPSDELMVHTWLNATFKEITLLIKGAIDEAKQKGTRLVFSAVYPTPTGQMIMKEIGELTTGKKGDRDLIGLGQTRFKIGDYLDVAIYPPIRGSGSSRRF